MPIRRRLLALALLLALSFLTSIPVPPAHAAWTLWYVDDTGTNSPACGTAVDPCRTIQYAIDKALDGDALSVAAGTYSTAATGEIFPITISKSISLHGAGRAITTIDAASAGLYVISASGNMNVYIDNFTIRGGIRGIDLQGAYPGVITGGIEDNSITGNSVGIYSYSTQVSVRANDISGNVHKGVHFVGSSNAVIAQNIFGWNGSGERPFHRTSSIGGGVVASVDRGRGAQQMRIEEINELGVGRDRPRAGACAEVIPAEVPPNVIVGIERRTAWIGVNAVESIADHDIVGHGRVGGNIGDAASAQIQCDRIVCDHRFSHIVIDAVAVVPADEVVGNG